MKVYTTKEKAMNKTELESLIDNLKIGEDISIKRIA